MKKYVALYPLIPGFFLYGGFPREVARYLVDVFGFDQKNLVDSVALAVNGKGISYVCVRLVNENSDGEILVEGHGFYITVRPIAILEDFYILVNG